MDIKKKTTIFTIASSAIFALAVIIYDIYAINEGGTEASISFMVFTWSYKYPLFTFMCGFIGGALASHFFWRIRDTKGTKILTDNSRK